MPRALIWDVDGTVAETERDGHLAVATTTSRSDVDALFASLWGIACGITRSVFFANARFEGGAWVRDDLEAPERMTLARLLADQGGTIAPS